VDPHVPATVPADQEPAETGSPWWWLAAQSLIPLALAVGVLQPDLWAQIEHPGRRYRLAARVLEWVGQVPLAAVLGVIGLIMLGVAIRRAVRGR
jgi:ABC-type phosphate transport system auxiliary subunit